MKFGVNSLLWTPAFDASHIALLGPLREHGFDGIEIARFAFEGFPAAQIRRAVEQHGLECTFCSALTGDLSLASEDADIRRKAREFLLAGIQTTAEVGASVFVGPFVAPVGLLCGRRRTEDEWKRGVEGLQSLVPALEQYRVTLAIEALNRFETYVLNTMADGADLCAQVGSAHVGLLFDTFHANIEEKSLGAAIRRAGRHIRHVHTCENDRGAPGSGHVPWTEVAQALHEIGYNQWLVIESFGSRIKEIAAAACMWRDVAASAEDLAYEGVKFLRSTFAAAA